MEASGSAATGSVAGVPVSILTGFSGAGKTSLLNHIISSGHGKRIPVIVNDFGAVNIDQSLIENRDGEILSLENGCICCSLSAGLQVAAARLVCRQPQPDHIVIETSGISDPLEVARAFGDPELKPYAPVEGVVTVVDAELAPTLEGDMLRMAQHQVYAADVIVLNETDLLGWEGRRRATDWLHAHAPRARMVEAIHGKVPLEVLFDIGGAAAIESDEGPRRGKTAPPHDQLQFDAYTFESEVPLSAMRLYELLRQLPTGIFRVKGIVNLEEKPGYPCMLQSTGKRATLTIGQAWGSRTPATRIVFIGAQGAVDRTWLAGRLTTSESA